MWLVVQVGLPEYQGYPGIKISIKWDYLLHDFTEWNNTFLEKIQRALSTKLVFRLLMSEKCYTIDVTICHLYRVKAKLTISMRKIRLVRSVLNKNKAMISMRKYQFAIKKARKPFLWLCTEAYIWFKLPTTVPWIKTDDFLHLRRETSRLMITERHK